jgi:hypothetical protein
LKALGAINAFKEGNTAILKNERWLLYIGITKEANINMERVASLKEMKNNYVLNYVQRTLEILEGLSISDKCKDLVEETLKWSEAAKGGLPHKRREWKEKGYNLFAHNIGSADIYREETQAEGEYSKVIYTLIKTHGLIGQYLRGEVTLYENKPLIDLILEGYLDKDEFTELVQALNICIISGVSEELWMQVKVKVTEVIKELSNRDFTGEYSVKERLRALRAIAIGNGENFEEQYHKYLHNEEVYNTFNNIFFNAQLWYVEAALYDFTFEEFIKIFILISKEVSMDTIKHISFEAFMRELYYERQGQKRVNIYKKRIIENYLSAMSVEELLKRTYADNIHVSYDISNRVNRGDSAFFTFKFSKAAEKLIEFCTEAESSGVAYEKAILLLFDLFGLRKDKYDRFYEEEAYLNTMNSTIDYKKIILDFITGNSVVDIGPGGGALMDLIEERYPEKNITGVDISQNVIDALTKKKHLESHRWNVLYGDALNLSKYIEKGSVDTIIFCSIMHELFSYIEYEGKKFNHDTLAAALRSSFEILPKGGRIIIRDGIMTEPIEQKRIIRFLSQEGMEFLNRYASDFEGRKILYEIVGHNEVMMPVNDAMEFLYTFTWGEESYVHEINEQFGYFTPKGFKSFVTSTLGDSAKIIEWRNYLQEGYSIALSQKIQIFDENRKEVRLPDSTCLLVIEKQ